MRLIGGLLLFLILIVGFNACFEPPHDSIIPAIDFSSIIFKNETDPSADDSLIVTLSFKDGDGDLGLSSDPYDDEGIYANKYYFLVSGKKVYVVGGATISNPAVDSAGNLDSLISYRTKRKAAGHPNDTLPAFVTPFSCTNWDVITDATTHKVADTLYCQLNPNTYNIFVDIYVKQADGTFLLFDWKSIFIYPNCYVAGFNGRFPILSSDPSKPAPLEGKIRYAMTSAGWTSFFSTKTLQLKITVQDRSLHRSNTITTPPFDLKSITQN